MKKKGKIFVFGDRSYLIEDQEGKGIKYESNRISRLNIPAQEIEFEYDVPGVKEAYHVVYANSLGTSVRCSNGFDSEEKMNAYSYDRVYGQVKFTITDGKLTGVEIV